MLFLTIENQDDRLKVERLYFQYRKLMYKEAYSILQDYMLAEDAISESFVRIINNLHKIDENNCPRTRSFLVIICRNVAKDIYKAKRMVTVDYDEIENTIIDERVSANNPEDIVISEENVQRIADIIQNLDPIYRDVFLLRRVHGFSREEIAQIFNISIESVKKRLVRAKQKIIEKMKGDA